MRDPFILHILSKLELIGLFHIRCASAGSDLAVLLPSYNELLVIVTENSITRESELTNILMGERYHGLRIIWQSEERFRSRKDGFYLRDSDLGVREREEPIRLSCVDELSGDLVNAIFEFGKGYTRYASVCVLRCSHAGWSYE